MRKKNKVFILGAGSSHDFGYPLGDGIFLQVKKLIENGANPEIKGKLTEIFNEVIQIMADVYSNLPKDEREYPLFEEVLTFIWDAKKFEYQDWENGGRIVSLFKEGSRRVLDIFIKMLMLTLSQVGYASDSKKKLQLYERFIMSLDFKNNNISFISLNYDLIIDNILLKCVKEKVIRNFNYGCSMVYLNDKNRYRTEGIQLLKPHGSLNLSFCTGHRDYGTLYYYCEHDITFDLLNKSEGTRCPISNCGAQVKPVIVPPLYMKESYIRETNKVQIYQSKRPNHISDEGVVEQYRKYVDKKITTVLQEADEISVIGYSMPAYDFDFKSLLMKGLMANKNRENIPINIITKTRRKDLEILKTRFGYLAGRVEVVNSEGFYSYLKNQ